MKKNILELCLSPDLGGLELCVVDYFKYLKKQTSTYLCVAPDKKLDTYMNNNEENNKTTLKRNKFLPFIPAFKLVKYIDKYEIDIIHFHWTKDISTVVLAKVFSKRKPKIIQSRHMTMTRFKDDVYHKWLYKHIDVIHAVTYQVKEQLEKYISKDVRPKIEMVYLGVDEPLFNTDKVNSLREEYNLNNSFVVGIIGRIQDGKGQYLLIEALNKLKDLDIKILIVGHTMNEDYLEKLKKDVITLGLEEKVLFTGFTNEINEHIQLCDITVLATKKETFGLVVIESMINSVPVIATAVGGPLEIIEDKVNGLFFDRSSNDLAEKIRLLYENIDLKKSLKEEAFKNVKSKFNKEKQMKKIYEVISESCVINSK